MSHAKIWYVENFITDEECAFFREHGKDNLKRATVAGPDGTSVISNHRKANQAHYSLPRHDHESSPVW